MSRYSLLCVVSIVFALFQSIVAAPKNEKGSRSEGENSRSSSGVVSLSYVKNLANKVGQEVCALGVKLGLKRERWEDVMFSEVGNEKGVLKAIIRGRNPVYCFFPNFILDNGHTTGVHTEHCFRRRHLTKVTRDGTVVSFELSDDHEYTLTFANDDDALQFIGDKSD